MPNSSRKGPSLFGGGIVRDRIVSGLSFEEIAYPDLDIATNLLPDEVCKQLRQKGIHAIFDEAKSFGVVRARDEHTEVEIATFRSDGRYVDGRHPDKVTFVSTLEEDAKRRDFTCNAIYYNPLAQEFKDPTGGIIDLENKILRTVGDPETRFQEDYLRMIRYCRFRTKLRFKFSRDIQKIIKANASKISQISGERIKTELDKGFILPYANQFIGDLERTGLLPYFLPEVSDLKSVDHPPEYHKEGGVYRHTLASLRTFSLPSYFKRIAKLFPDLEPIRKRSTELFLRELFSHVGIEVAWAVLLHDIGKKPAHKVVNGKVNFIDHQFDSTKMLEAIFDRFRFSTKEQKIIAWLVENHMRPQYIPKMRDAKRKAFLREPLFLQMILLYLSDAMGNYGLDYISEFDECVEMYMNEPKGDERLKQDKELKNITDGDWLMKQFHLKPGKEVGEMKKGIERLWLEGAVKSREEVIHHLANPDVNFKHHE